MTKLICQTDLRHNEQKPCAVVLSEGYTASTDYYLIPYLEKLGYCTSLLDYRQNLPAIADFLACQLVVISRYISHVWLKFLTQLANQQTVKIVYFMDDDLFDLQALAGLPWIYRWKIITKALAHRKKLAHLCHEFWFSTSYLAEKYPYFQPVLLSPVNFPNTQISKKPIQVCYHDTGSHQREIDWLLPIIAEVQSYSNNIHFELFGSRAVAKATYNIPRVSVRHQMSWSNYRAFTCVQKKHWLWLLCWAVALMRRGEQPTRKMGRVTTKPIAKLK